MSALKLEYDNVEERIVEIPIPENSTENIDFMGAVDKNVKTEKQERLLE